ncbi:hypothetical protein T492DRAFT_858131, partial [Pavlovales sp. CCMP2436]
HSGSAGAHALASVRLIFAERGAIALVHFLGAVSLGSVALAPPGTPAARPRALHLALWRTFGRVAVGLWLVGGGALGWRLLNFEPSLAASAAAAAAAATTAAAAAAAAAVSSGPVVTMAAGALGRTGAIAFGLLCGYTGLWEPDDLALEAKRSFKPLPLDAPALLELHHRLSAFPRTAHNADSTSV